MVNLNDKMKNKNLKHNDKIQKHTRFEAEQSWSAKTARQGNK